MPPSLRSSGPINIRWAVSSDYQMLADIDYQCFANDAWTANDFRSELARLSVIGMVAERGHTILGYMVYELQGTTAIKLLSIAIHADAQRQGVGKMLLVHLVKKLTGGRNRIGLYVRESNLAAQKFFAACGFRATSVTRGYYQDTGEDAYRMLLRV